MFCKGHNHHHHLHHHHHHHHHHNNNENNNNNDDDDEDDDMPFLISWSRSSARRNLPSLRSPKCDDLVDNSQSLVSTLNQSKPSTLRQPTALRYTKSILSTTPFPTVVSVSHFHLAPYYCWHLPAPINHFKNIT